MWLIAHAIDFAVVNSWLEYVRDAKKANYPKNSILDLLEFRTMIREDLILVGRTLQSKRKRGRPSQNSGEHE